MPAPGYGGKKCLLSIGGRIQPEASGSVLREHDPEPGHMRRLQGWGGTLDWWPRGQKAKGPALPKSLNSVGKSSWETDRPAPELESPG